jgi:threonine dehydrogenase-like Zn-dependent dehydrogenase
MCAKWSLLKGAKHIILVDKVQWRLDLCVEKLRATGHENALIDTVNFTVDKNVVKKIQELTAPGTNGLDSTRPAGVDVSLECAAGEYAVGIGHKIELAVGLETDTSEILNWAM